MPDPITNIGLNLALGTKAAALRHRACAVSLNM